MRRRELISAGMAASAALLTTREAKAQERVDQAARGMKSPIIRDISVIQMSPQGVRLVIVKVTTDQAGLYGYGCATFTQRADPIPIAVRKISRSRCWWARPPTASRIPWQMAYNSSYWRNSGVLNNAISGVDQALWDIKGRQAGLPVYQLLGGKARLAADCYAHASGSEIKEVIDQAKVHIANGFRHVRIQVGVPGMAGYGSRAQQAQRIPRRCTTRRCSSAKAISRRALALFEACAQGTGHGYRAAARHP